MKEVIEELQLLTEKKLNEIFLTNSVSQNKKSLSASVLNSPLGQILAIADDGHLFLLEFTNRKNLEAEIIRLCKLAKAEISWGLPLPIKLIKKELNDYFSGDLAEFKTPLCMIGTPFQKEVWRMLQKIPIGHVWSYAVLANAIGKPQAFRAVALANSKNQFAIIVPCHRVIKSDGFLCGYGGGIQRKKWLIEHENLYKAQQHHLRV